MNLARARLELGELAASSTALHGRAQDLLAATVALIPSDGAWIALADPMTSSYSHVGSIDLDESTLRYFGGPQMAQDIELTGANRVGGPMSPSDLPYPAEQLATWAECLLPAGYCEALGIALHAPGGRQVGIVGLLSVSADPPSRETRRLLVGLSSVLARGVDPMRSLVAIARLVKGATAGVVLRADGRSQPLPGLDGHDLLVPGSPVVTAAREALRAGHQYRSFLWPLGGRHPPNGHIRVTALAGADDIPELLVGIAVVSTVGNIRHLTRRELEVLGLLIEGHSNQEIAETLVVAQRTVAAHVEHILGKFSAPTRTLAAVRAEREGLYVPSNSLAPPGP